METRDFQAVLHQVSTLSLAQLKQLRHATEHELSTHQVGQLVADKEEAICPCPHCESADLNRWGMTPQGIQRYRCKACFKTFSALTNTPLHRMRKSEKWLQYTAMMRDGVSLREAAARLSINLKTSFRWRHAFLKAPTRHRPDHLAGVIEADETFLKESFKGCRNMPRPARKRGGGRETLTPIIIAMNRSGDVSDRVLKRNTRKEIQDFLKPLLTEGSVLCTDGNDSYDGVTGPLHIEHKRLVAAHEQRVVEGVYHIQTLNNYMMNWKGWMGRFKGVSTKYLHHYLGWHRFMYQTDYSQEEWIRAAL